MNVWNGYYACSCYHALVVFNQFGDLERSALRPGNGHGADGWDGTPKPVVVRYQGKVSRIYFRAEESSCCPRWRQPTKPTFCLAGRQEKREYNAVFWKSQLK